MVTPIEQGLLAGGLGLLMLGLGTTLSLSDFRRVLSRPRAALVGLACQLLWMPLVALTLAKILALPAPLALALVLVGCTPGGSTSNMYSHFARADVALSIGMTALSTAMALVTLPALAWLYGHALGLARLEVPVGKIAGATLFVLVPVALGMELRRRRPAWARKVERVGNLAGLGAAISMVSMWAPRMWHQASTLPSAAHLAIALLICAGMGAGYVGGRLAHLPAAQTRAVVLEAGLQNTPLTFAVIQLSFAPSQAERMAWVPLLYGFSVVMAANLLTILFRWSAAPTRRARPAAGTAAVPR